MGTHNDFGKEAEQKAVEYLASSGYEIIEKNWRYGKAEIDIVVKRLSELVVVEVKARSYTTIMNPEEAVTLSKKKLLIMAANEYVIRNNLDVDVRFDIISIVRKADIWKINHIENAFNALL